MCECVQRETLHRRAPTRRSPFRAGAPSRPSPSPLLTPARHGNCPYRPGQRLHPLRAHIRTYALNQSRTKQHTSSLLPLASKQQGKQKHRARDGGGAGRLRGVRGGADHGGGRRRGREFFLCGEALVGQRAEGEGEGVHRRLPPSGARARARCCRGRAMMGACRSTCTWSWSSAGRACTPSDASSPPPSPNANNRRRAQPKRPAPSRTLRRFPTNRANNRLPSNTKQHTTNTNRSSRS